MEDGFIWTTKKKPVDAGVYVRVNPDYRYLVLSREARNLLYDIRPKSTEPGKTYFVDVGMSPDGKTLAVRPGDSRQMDDYDGKIMWKDLQNCTKGQYNLSNNEDGVLYFQMDETDPKLFD